VWRIRITLMQNRIWSRLFTSTGCTFLDNRLRLSVADSHHFDAEPGLDTAFYFYGDPDPTFYFDVDPDLALHFDSDPNPAS
jgi:hypothetical protein